MTFISLSDIPDLSGGTNCPAMSKVALRRRSEDLRDRIDIHKRELARLNGELELRGLAAGSIRLDPQLITNEIGLLRRAIAKDLRRLARFDMLAGQCRDAAEDVVESVDLSIVDPFRGKLLSAEARGLGEASPSKPGRGRGHGRGHGRTAQAHFPGLPSAHLKKARRTTGMSDDADDNESDDVGDDDDMNGDDGLGQVVGLDDCHEAGLEMRSLVQPERVITAQAPVESPFKSNAVIEESGDMANQSPDGDQYAYEGLSGSATHAYDYVGNGAANGAGLGDSVDAGGVEPFVDVQSEGFSLDDGGAVSGDLVEPGTIPEETTNTERAPGPQAQPQRQMREVVKAPRERLVNAIRYQPGANADAMGPMRGPAPLNGTGGRLDAQRELMRRQMNGGSGMGQESTTALDVLSKGLDVTSQVVPAVLQRPGQPGQYPPGQYPPGQALRGQQESSVSRYMPLLIIGGIAIVAVGGYMIFGNKKPEPTPLAEAPPAPFRANRGKKAKRAKRKAASR